MKKIFALLIAVTAVGSVFAQSNRNWDNRDDHRETASVYNRNNDRYDNNRFTAKERDAQINRINAIFDQRIEAVQRDRRLKNSARKQEIRQLEEQRRNKIREVNERYARQSTARYDNRNNDRYNDRYDRNDSRRF